MKYTQPIIVSLVSIAFLSILFVSIAITSGITNYMQLSTTKAQTPPLCSDPITISVEVGQDTIGVGYLPSNNPLEQKRDPIPGCDGLIADPESIIQAGDNCLLNNPTQVQITDKQGNIQTVFDVNSQSWTDAVEIKKESNKERYYTSMIKFCPQDTKVNAKDYQVTVLNPPSCLESCPYSTNDTGQLKQRGVTNRRFPYNRRWSTLIGYRPNGTNDLTPIPNPTIPLDACDLDIGLVVDNSRSIGSNINKIQTAILGFIEGLTGSQARISLVIFSDDAKTIQPLTLDYQAVKNNIWSFDLSQGGTNLADAIAASRDTFDTSKKNPKIMIIATDGTPTLPDNATGFQKAIAEAQITKSSPYNIRIIAMAMGDHIDLHQLSQIVGSNIDDSNIIDSDVVTTNFDKLGNDLKLFSNNLCKNKIIVNKFINRINNNSLGGSDWDFEVAGKSVSTQPDGKTIPMIVTPGVDYSVIENNVKPNYTFDKAVCVNQNNNPLGKPLSTGKGVEKINLAPREVAVCNFINLGPTLAPITQPTITPWPITPTVTPILSAVNPNLSTKQCGLNIGFILIPPRENPPGGPALPGFAAPSQSSQSVKDVYINIIDALADYPVQFSLIGYDNSVSVVNYYEIIQPLTSDTDLLKDKINSYIDENPFINLQDGIIKARASFFPRINNGLIISPSDGSRLISNQNYTYVNDYGYEHQRVINDTIIEANATKKLPYNIKLINLIPGLVYSDRMADLMNIFGNNVNNPDILKSDIIYEREQPGSLSLFVSELTEFVKNRCESTITVNKYINNTNPGSYGGENWQFSVGTASEKTNNYGQTNFFNILPGQFYSVTENNIKPDYSFDKAVCYNQKDESVGNPDPFNLAVGNISIDDKDIITCNFVNSGPTLTPMPPTPIPFPCLPLPEDVPDNSDEYTISIIAIRVHNWINNQSSNLKLDNFTTIACDQDITDLKLTEIDFDDLRQQGIDLDCASPTKTSIDIYPHPMPFDLLYNYSVKMNYKLNARALCYQAEFIDIDNNASKSAFKCYTGSDNLCFIKNITSFFFADNDIRPFAAVSNNNNQTQTKKPNLIKKIFQGLFNLFK